MNWIQLVRCALVTTILVVPSACLFAQDFWQVYSRSPFGNVYQVCPAGQNAMLINTDSGVLRTSDGGAHWLAAGVPPASLTPYGGSSSIIRTSSGTIIAATDTGLYRSVNNGASWVQESAKSAGYCIVAGADLYVEYSDTNRYFWRIYRSSDDGASWSIANSNLVPLISEYHRPIAYAITGDNRIIAFAQLSSFYSGCVISSDTGWVFTGRGEASNYIVRSTSGVLFGGGGNGVVQRSSDNGADWEDVAPDFPVLGLWPSPAGNLFGVSWTLGVDYSTDNGSTWTRENSGLTNTTVYSVGFDDQGYAYAGSFDAIFKSIQRHLGVVPPRPSGKLAAYPNPCSASVTLVLPSNDARANISLFDSRGVERMSTVTGADGAASLDVSKLPGGLYMAQIRYADGSLERTLIAHE